MNRIVATSAALLLLAIATATAPQPALAESTTATEQGIVLVAGRTVDLKWDPEEYPNPNFEPFVRWELWRKSSGAYVRLVWGIDEDGFVRDTVPTEDTTYWYYLDVIRENLSGQEVPYRVFGAVSALSGTVRGTLFKNLTLDSGDFDVVGAVSVPAGYTLAIGDGTTLRGASGSAKIVAQGGTLQINGGTYHDLRIQFGDPTAPEPTGDGWVKSATFGTSASSFGSLVEFHGKGGQFELFDNTALQVEAHGSNRLHATANTVGGRLTAHDNTVATIEINHGLVVYLGDESQAVIKSNLETSVHLSGKATAKIEKNDKVDLVIAEDEATVEVLENKQVGWVQLRDNAQATILGDSNDSQRIEQGIEVEGSARAAIRDNTIESGGIYVTGYGAPDPNKKAYADIASNKICSLHKNAGVEVYSGASAKVRDGNLIEWTGFHGDEGTILLAAAGQGTKLIATGNTLIHGKLLVYDRASVAVADNVIKGGGAAITIGCVVCTGDVEGVIEKNTVQQAWGFEVWDHSPRLVIRHNCIRGNSPGLTTDDLFMTGKVDVRHNWWGHRSGPKHPSNPGGLGDKIVGTKVDFVNWDQTDKYCRDKPPAPHPPDFSAIGLEVVQSIQDLNNSVPWVAGKETLVRAYVRSTSLATGVSGKLEIYDGGQLVMAPSPSGTAWTFWAPDPEDRRSSLSMSINFFLDPDKLTEGTYTFKFKIDPASIEGDLDPSNNSTSKEITFTERRPLRVLFVPIKFLGGKPGIQNEVPTAADAEALRAGLQALYPVAKVAKGLSSQITLARPLKFGAGTVFQRGDTLIRRLNAWLGYWNRTKSPQAPYDQVVGLVAPTIKPLMGGLYGSSDPRWLATKLSGADRIGRGLGVASFALAELRYVGHEIGHNFGLLHPDTPDAGITAKEETYWHLRYPDATIQEYGFDFRSRNVVPKSYFDIMSYQKKAWLSPLHYERIFMENSRPPGATATQGRVPAQELDAGQPYLLAGGTISLTGEVAFDPFWQITSTLEALNPPEGTDYCLEMLDAGDSVLAGHCFDLGFYNHEAWSDTESDSFLIMLPVDPAAARVVLRQGATELGEVPVSANPPSVTLEQPNGGEMPGDSLHVAWTATDVDGDPLAFNLLYSTDGEAWQPVADGIQGVTEYDLDLDMVPGGTDAWLRIEASDGYHTSMDDSDGPFTVPDKAPSVLITDPEDGATVYAPVTLIGAGHDLEDGTVDGAELGWTSDLDGALGAGDYLLWEDPTEGVHIITLSATDSQAQVGSDSITITVEVPRVYLPTMRRK